MTPTRPVRVLVSASEPLAREIVEQRLAATQAETAATAELRWLPDPDALTAALDQAYDGQGDVVVVPGTEADLAAFLPARIPARSDRGPRLIRVDPHVRPVDPTPQLTAHIAGRGLDGISWAVRAAVHHAQWPVQRIAYGPHPEQFGELRRPANGAAVGVVVLLHGGFWRSRWQLDLMDALGTDLARRGIVSWNVEYRRPDRHGWNATTADVEAAVLYLAHLGEVLDPQRVAVVGHSAGGQLAVRVCADLHRNGAAVRPLLAVPQAGVLDLFEAHRRDLGQGAIGTALGAAPEAAPAVYRASSPVALAPTSLPSLVVIGRDDDADLNEMAYRYVAAVQAAGGDAEILVDAGGHFSVIDPAATVWKRTADHLSRALAIPQNVVR